MSAIEVRGVRKTFRVKGGLFGVDRHVVAVDDISFAVPAGGVLALLPLEAKENVQTGVIGYGGLLAALGMGTTLGVSILPVVQRRIRLNRLSALCIVVFALASAGCAVSTSISRRAPPRPACSMRCTAGRPAPATCPNCVSSTATTTTPATSRPWPVRSKTTGATTARPTSW